MILMIPLALLLVSCSPPREPVRIGILVWPPYEIAFLAQQLDLYPTATIRLVDYQTPAELARAYRYGLIDGMFVTSQFMLDSMDLPRNSRLVYVIDASHGGDGLVARADIQELSQLAGKTIGVEAGPLGAYFLQRVLDHAKLDRTDVNLAFVDTPDQGRTFEQGRLDAVITYEPTRQMLLDSGANELFSSSSIPYEILDILVVHGDVLEEREKTLRDFVTGLSKAVARFSEISDEQMAPLAARQGLSLEAFKRAMGGAKLMGLRKNHQMMTGEPTPLSTYLSRQIEVMTRAGLIAKPVSPETIVDSRLVMKAVTP